MGGWRSGVGESRVKVRTMDSSSESGKSSDPDSDSRPCCSAFSLWRGKSSGARGESWVSSSVKSRSWVDMKARRSAGLSVAMGSALLVAGGLGGVGGCGGGRQMEVALLGDAVLVGGVGGGESSRWIWVLLTKKESR